MITRFRIKDHWAEQRMFMFRAVAAGVLLLTLTLALVVKLAHLQILRYDYYSDLSQGNRVRIEPVPPNRGLILDRNGVVLAENLPAYQLELTVEQLPTTAKGSPDIDGALNGLIAIGLISAEDLPRLKRLIRSRRSFEGVPVRLQLTDEEVARFAVRRLYFQGVDIKTRLTRHYPMGRLAVHALGYVGAISERDMARIDEGEYAGTTLIGKVGIEESYEKELHGTPGFRQVLVNAQGRPVERESALQADLSRKAAISGDDLVLSLDSKLQRIAEEALGERRGAVIAIDPANGDVLTLVSMPGFDPHPFGRGLTVKEYSDLQNDIDKPLLNRALRGAYPSGSTIKPVIALAGLTYKVMTPFRTKFCAGMFRLPNSRLQFREGRTGRHGNMDMEHAIAKSCDVYFYDLSVMIGAQRIADFLAPFGYGERTGIDIGGEKPGLLPSPEWKKKHFKRREDQVWFPGETVNFGIGQGYLLVTPMQLAHVTSILAGRGKSFRPRLVTAIRHSSGHASGKTTPIAPKVNPAIDGLKAADWDIIFKGMIGAVTYGTAAYTVGKSAPYSIAGKTGTAQVYTVSRNERLSDKFSNERLKDHSWFIAFAPAEAPKIAVAVLVENGGFGSVAAAPIARKVMDGWLLGPESVESVIPAATAQAPDTPAVPKAQD